MKKLIIVLMIVSMAALLFTGCLPTKNHPPVITTTSLPNGTIGTEYTTTITATDADGDALTFTLVSKPTGMVISNAGVISGWTPAAAGTYDVTVTVTDGKDPVITADFTITVPSVVPGEITIAVKDEYPDTATGKTYVKGGSREITVTFPSAVDTPVVKVGTIEVPVFSVDGKVWKGTHKFTGDCEAVMITVGGICEDLCAAKSVVVDSGKPYAELKAIATDCLCATGTSLTITSDWKGIAPCPPDYIGCCGDGDCSGLASWNVKIYQTPYDESPWDECCAPVECIDPIAEEDGTECPVSITTERIEDVYTKDGWKGFYDYTYWVIATLTDKVGNEITYYGQVRTDGSKLVSFVELYLDPTTVACWCPAEDPSAADLVIGDCDGTPAVGCWYPPLKPCPTVTLDPAEPMVGQLTTITIDYDDAVKPTGKVSAYVGPAIKTLPIGIPEGVQELVLSGPVDDVYTATYTFGQAGIDYIYVYDYGTGTLCTEGVTVSPAKCPEILIAGEILFGDHWYVSGGQHDITIKYDVPTDGVRLFISEYWLDPILPADLMEIELSTTDNMTFTGTQTEFSEDCKKMWLYVLSGDSCCPVVCSRTVIVDDEGPYVGLVAEMVYCPIGDCPPYDTGYKITISTQTDPDECDPDCCGDTCTTVAEWSIEIFNYYDGYGVEVQPYDDCCERQDVPACDIVDVVTGDVCNISYTGLCVADTDWIKTDYKVIVTLADIVGNTRIYDGILSIDITSGVTATIDDASLSDDCQRWTDANDDGVLGYNCFPLAEKY